jgi:hypothetical protein
LSKKRSLDDVSACWDSIAADAYRLVHGVRGASYNHPAVVYSRTVEIFRAITGIDLEPEEGVLFMVAVKLSRLANGMDEEFPAELQRDTLVDLAGYHECLYGVMTYEPPEPDDVDDLSEEDDE